MNMSCVENAQWNVNYDYDTSRDCDENGCDSICRCSKIKNERVTDVDVAGIVNEFYGDNEISEDDVIRRYCIDRVFRFFKIYDTDIWDIETYASYYGEEVGRISIDWHVKRDLSGSLEELLNLESDSDLIEYVLVQEYAYLRDDLRHRIWKLMRVDRKYVEFGARDHAKNVYSRRRENDFYSEISLPQGIALEDGHMHRLVDGYHRCLTSKSDELYLIVG